MNKNIKKIFSDNPEILNHLSQKELMEKMVSNPQDSFIESMRKVFKGEDGYSPVKGTDYFTDDEINSFKADILKGATPQKFKDYFTPQELDLIANEIRKELKTEVTPIKGQDYFDGKDGIDGEDGKDADEQLIVEKVLKKIPSIPEFDPKSILDKVPTLESLVNEIKKKKLLELRDIKGARLDMNDQRWHGGGISNINGLIIAGTNITITGSGIQSDPYVINSTGGGSAPGGVQYDIQLNDGSGGFAGSNNLNFQGGYLTINGDSGYGQLQWLNTPLTGGYAGSGISGIDNEIINGALAGDMTFWSSQAMNFSSDTGNTNMLRINTNGTIDIGSLASMATQFVLADLNGELISQALLIDGITITGDGITTPLTATASGSGTVTSVASADSSITVTNPTTTVDLAVVKSPKLTTARTIGILTGDATTAGSSFDGTANNTNVLTLATVNSNVGTFGSATQSTQITANGKGLITAIANITITPAASSITGGAALTRTNDTNVTLTLGGTPSTALLVAASMTLGWSGQLANTRGGTGLDTSAASGVAQVASGTWSVSTALANGTTATTQSAGDNTTKIATDAFVTTAITNAIAGVNPAVAVSFATTQASDTSGYTYNNGVSGIGATLTGSNNVAFTADGQMATALLQRVLIKNDTQSPSGAFNGVYYVSQLQTAILPPILTRALDYDQPSDINSTGAIPVVNGTLNASTSWLLTSSITTVGTDPLTYIKFSINPTTIQTTSLTSAHLWVGNVSNLAVDIAVSGDLTLANTGAFTVAKIAGTTVSGTTGSGNVVFSTSPTLVTPALGTPSALILTNATGLPVAGGGTGLATTTAYGVIHGGTTATGNFQNSGTPGASGTVYTSTGATSLPTWQAVAGGATPGWTQKVANGTGSGVTSVSITSLSLDTEFMYELVVDYLFASADSLGITFNTDTGANYMYNAFSELTNTLQGNTNYIKFYDVARGDLTHGFMRCVISRRAATTIVTVSANGTCHSDSINGVMGAVIMGGSWNSTANITSIQFKSIGGQNISYRYALNKITL